MKCIDFLHFREQLNLAKEVIKKSNGLSWKEELRIGGCDISFLPSNKKACACLVVMQVKKSSTSGQLEVRFSIFLLLCDWLVYVVLVKKRNEALMLNGMS